MNKSILTATILILGVASFAATPAMARHHHRGYHRMMHRHMMHHQMMHDHADHGAMGGDHPAGDAMGK